MPNLAYLELKDLAGVSKIMGREKWHPVTAFHHKIERPIEPLTLQPSQRKVHGLFVIQKEIDVGSHWFHRLHQANKPLGVCRLRLYHMPPHGDEVNYLTIELKNARIVEIEMMMPTLTLQKNATIKEFEKISFMYDEISFKEEKVQETSAGRGQPGQKIAVHKMSGLFSQHSVFHVDWVEEQKKAVVARVYGELAGWIKGKLGKAATESKIFETISKVDLVELFKARARKGKVPAIPTAVEPE